MAVLRVFGSSHRPNGKGLSDELPAPMTRTQRLLARVLVLLVVGLSATAIAQPSDRPRYSFRACEGSAVCTDEQARHYREAFARNEPVIELVTMGIGELIWERHGHIALCVRWANPRNDVCYNYGIGNFQAPIGMAWGFFRGTKSFWAGAQSVTDIVRVYVGGDRSVWAQPIPLDAAQKQQVIDRLQRDILEENKYYSYDHFWDNCTTRVRDILDDVTHQALSTMQVPGDGKTFRDLAREGFYGMRVPLLITDIAMGAVTDREPTYWERMFLPQYLREAVEKRWGIAPIELYKRVGPPPPSDSPSGRWLLALIIIALTAPAWLSRWRGRFERLGMAVAILPQVLLGSVLWFLAIISPLSYVRWNESCLILLPLDLLLLVLAPPHRVRYARGRVVMLLVILLLQLVGVLRQPLCELVLWPLIPAAVVAFWPPRAPAGSIAKPR